MIPTLQHFQEASHNLPLISRLPQFLLYFLKFLLRKSGNYDLLNLLSRKSAVAEFTSGTRDGSD